MLIACCEPVVIMSRSLSTGNPFSARNHPRDSSSEGSPAVGPYWKAVLFFETSSREISSSISSMGKRSLSGMPPAKEMIPGRPAIFIKSRISDERSEDEEEEKRGIQSCSG